MVVDTFGLLNLLLLDLISDLFGLFLFHLLEGKFDGSLEIIVVVNDVSHLDVLDSFAAKLLSSLDLFIDLVGDICLGNFHFVGKNFALKLSLGGFHVDGSDIRV